MGPFNPSDYFWLIGLGIVVGVYGTLIGAGGGFILMPILLLMHPKASPDELTAISLAVVFFNAAAGSESYAMMGRIDYKTGLMFAAATIPGAVIGAINTSAVPRALFNAIFGVMLLAAGVFLFFRSPFGGHKSKGRTRAQPHRYSVSRHIVSATGEEFDYSFNPLVGIAISFGVGYASSFLGIGGGIIHVPALIFLLGFPVHVATATSHFILAFMALAGTMVHLWMGSFHEGARPTLSLAIGVLLGAPIGAYISNRIRGRWIIRSLALALCLVGIRILGLFFQH